MRKVVVFDEFAYQCPHYNGKSKANNGYGCDHPKQTNTETIDGIKYGCCYCGSCPLGVEVEDEDIGRDDVDFQGFCEEGYVSEGEYLMIDCDEDATPEQKEALFQYDRYLHRYDKKWLDEHGIPNSYCD